MFKNHLKIALRVLFRNKVYSFINIAGLALGISAFLLILEYVSLERSVNQFHANLPNMYRLLNQNNKGETWAQVEPGWATKAKERLPEIKEYCRVADGVAQGIVKNESKNVSFREKKMGYAEGNFFSFFSFPLLKGSASELNKPDVIFMAESAAKKYFDKADPIGQTLTLYNQFGKKDYVVKGVFADMGDNSDIKLDLVLSLETLKNPANLNGNDWASIENLDSQYIDTYFLLNEKTNYLALEGKLNTLRKELSKENDATNFRLQPFSEIHLASSFSDTYQHYGNVKYVFILSGIAFLILVIAWFNYINLSTANALKRANEVGVRKVIGATRSNLVLQFLGESMLVNLFAFVGAIFLVTLLQPFFNQTIQKELSLTTLLSSSLWIIGLGLLVIGSIGSGVYTAFGLANFKLIETLKGKLHKSTKGIFLRKSLVVTQFSISIALIIVTIIVFSQLKHMQNQDLGMNIKQLLVIKGPEIGKDSTYKSRVSAFETDIAQQSFVTDYCTSGSVPSNWYNFTTVGFTSAKSKAGDEQKAYSFVIIGNNFLKTYQIPLKAGRNFTAKECDVDWSDNSKVLLNEKAIEQLGFKSATEAVNAKIKWDERYLEVIGVVKDYHHKSLQTAIDPMIFYPQNNSSYLTVKLSGENMTSKVATLENIFKSHFSGNPFEFFFMDDNFNKQYETESQYSTLFTTASVWAIFIACMGLFGLATFTVESRTKEIGIRKILGASVLSIVQLLSKDFLILVFIAIVIACPIAYYFMQQWLQDFASRITIEWWYFVVAGALALGIALLTVGYQAIKSALMNPVKSLRTE
ncbi:MULTISPECIES: ABC transporter permease [unclassified Arcicella]|uniref:ABC transporter permease n=1 Tax=unclassified Arcicella TaxID=2644986 RepID=UPI0028605609|nr:MULTISPECIES: ABC transporter permease [unclassified Arcicella]MDR6563871.1 putative ABC transport system permease protein [Arcicella sp. BE51]MDR6813624.1 putative ABC transport system permease protein [Arcicella sp. BE140]MDR6824995.1 putative ABC transport system permease protein [Arcicella sp. BE139]